MMVQSTQPSLANLQIAPSGEPIIVVPDALPANDMVEIHVVGSDANILVDGDLFGCFTIMTNTLKSWLVMAEEVGIKAANSDQAQASPIYAPVYERR